MEFEIAHQVPGRLRAVMPLVARDAALTRGLEALLRALPGVSDVRTNPLARSVIVSYDPLVVPERAVVRLLANLTARHLQLPVVRLRTVPAASAGQSLHFHASAAPDASAGLEVGPHGAHAGAHVGGGFRLDCDASFDHTERFLEGALAFHSHFEEHLSIEVVAEAGFHGLIEVDLAHHRHLEVDFGFVADARATALARGMAEFDVEVAGWRVGVEGYLAFSAGEEIELAGWLTYHGGVLRVGAIAGAGLVVAVEWGAGLLLGLPPFLQATLDDMAQALQMMATTLELRAGSLGPVRLLDAAS